MLGEQTTLRHCQTMINIHKPSLLVLLETRMTDHKGIVQILGFNIQIQYPTSGNFEGIIITWKSVLLSIQDIVIHP